MIQSVEIQNFKCLERLEVSPLGQLTLIGGQNNVGKSALLEALFLFFDRMGSHLIARQYAWRGVQRVETRPENLWAPIFADYDMGNVISTTVTQEDQSETLEIRFCRDFRPPAPPPGNAVGQVDTDHEPLPTGALEFSYTASNRPAQKTFLYLDAQRGPAQYIEVLHAPLPVVSYLGGRVRPTAAEDAKSFGELDKIGKTELVVNFLRVIEPNLRSLSIILEAGEPVVHGDVGLSRKIPVAFMGDGVSRLLSIFLAMVRCRNSVLLLDEFENGFHYSVHTEIWRAVARAAAELKCQLIATTHSYEFLRHACEGLSDENVDDFRYVRLDRTREGVVARNYDFDMLKTAMESGLEVR